MPIRLRSTIYRKNVRQWEQWTRVVAGVAMAIVALNIDGLVLRSGLLASAVVLAVTGVVGWCPACAMVGRRLEQDASRRTSHARP